MADPSDDHGADPLTATFSALADPTRRSILARLASGEASVNEPARPFEMSLPAISKHLKVLELAGLIERSRDGQSRPCRLATGALGEAAAWAGRFTHPDGARPAPAQPPQPPATTGPVAPDDYLRKLQWALARHVASPRRGLWTR
jgi:DNA-binding transcriptional ArsR family regulator